MSSTLAYRPITPVDHLTLGDDLKYPLQGKFELSDGPEILGPDEIPYLEGLRDAGVESAEALIAGIKKYGELEIFLIY